MLDELERYHHLGPGPGILPLTEGQGPDGVAGIGEVSAVVEPDFKGLEMVCGEEGTGIEDDALEAEGAPRSMSMCSP